jgi:hypothetical protein
VAQIVAVHGIGQQLKGRNTLQATWLPAMQDGLELAGEPAVREQEFLCAFYGDLFRPPGRKGVGETPYTAADIELGFEQEFLEAWWRTAAATDPEVRGPDERTKLRTPQVAQRALNALSGSRFFAGLAERALIGFIKQVHRYFAEPELRAAVIKRVTEIIHPDTRVVIGHSLGSVVAYEALCARSDRPVRALITLGSPLGIRNLIFEQLHPAPTGGRGAWPVGVQQWTNIADRSDVVALVKNLASRFGDDVTDVPVDNGAKAHDVSPYLTARETGYAIASGLGG